MEPSQKFSVFDRAAAAVDLPELGVRAGDLGTIVDIYDDGAYEVEFDSDRDDSLVFGSIRGDQLSPAPVKQAA